MITIGTVLRLRGKTHKGKNRVRELGDSWVVIDELPQTWMICPEKERPACGPRLVTPEHARWIDKSNDRDFEVL